MQCFFRINGLESKKYSIELNNGSRIHTFFSKQYPKMNRFQLSDDSNDDKNLVDIPWIEEVFSI